MLVLAHRGDSHTYPENTLAAFQGAIDAGADGIEFDVQSSSDGELIIFHDDTLERTTNGEGFLTAASFPELRSLDAGSGEQIPSLEEVLALAGDRLLLDIEIKQPGVEQDVLRTLTNHPTSRWFISSFDWDSLRNCRAMNASAELWPLAEEFIDDLYTVAEELGAEGVALDWRLITADRMQEFRARHLKVAAWTVNDGSLARSLKELGVSTLITDDPRAMRDALRR